MIVPSGFVSLGEVFDQVEREVMGDEFDQPIRTISYGAVSARLLEGLEAGRYEAFTIEPATGAMNGIPREYWRTVFASPALGEGRQCHDLDGKTGLPFVIKARADVRSEPTGAAREIASGAAWKSKGGRPRAHDWDGALIEMARVAVFEDDSSPPALTKAVTEWFARTYGREPANSEIREKVRRFHEALWPPET